MTIDIDHNYRLELINESHSKQIFDLVDANRKFLRVWLPFVDNMRTIEFAENFVRGTMYRNSFGSEYAFVIIENEKMIGRVGVYKIDQNKKIAEIGYWLAEHVQGKGVVTSSCKLLIDFCFSELNLNRIEIKCGTENLKSQQIPERLNFSKECIIRQGELLHDKYIDLNLYSLLRQEYEMNI
jgi:ribosomal-protein-serine acetyltransferase